MKIEKRIKVWQSVASFSPPRGVVLDTKIDDSRGVRNEQPLLLANNSDLWFFPDGSMYVYYSPTHWRYQDAT